MDRGLRPMNLGFLLLVALCSSACGGEEEEKPQGISEGAGTGGGGTGGMTTINLGGSAGSGGGGASAGSTSGGSSGSGGADESGGGGMTGVGGDPNEPCTPASTEGIPYAGTCTYTDYCSDQYDASFGAETLQQICEGQSGTWATTPCDPTPWDIKCTQESFGGVYIHFMPADGICFDGCEEPL
jgi:hypothetical protein